MLPLHNSPILIDKEDISMLLTHYILAQFTSFVKSFFAFIFRFCEVFSFSVYIKKVELLLFSQKLENCSKTTSKIERFLLKIEKEKKTAFFCKKIYTIEKNYDKIKAKSSIKGVKR